MLLEDYVLYLEKTIVEQPDKVKRYLMRKYTEKNIVQKNDDKQLIISGSKPIDISEKKLVDQVLECIRNSTDSKLLYERWEFEKDYKYSVLFSCLNFDSVLQQLSQLHILEGEFENQYIFSKFEKPVVFLTEKYFFLKFNLSFAAIHPNTQEELFYKYPFLVVFHKEGEIVEFRFDTIKRLFSVGRNESNIYVELISNMIEFLKENYNCQLEAIDLNYLIEVVKNKKDKDIKLIAQFMKLPSGGNAQLSVGNNQEYILPFLGELRSLLSEFTEELEKTPRLNEALSEFFVEHEEMSDYPWIELLWENDIVTRRIHVKFTFNYMNKDYCLIQHYYSNALIGMERMNHVVEYIINNRGNGTGTV